MTIEYKDSKRIVKLSSDVVETPTYTPDLSSSSGWTLTAGGGSSSIANNEVTLTANSSADNPRATFDLGATVSDTVWLMTFKLVYSGLENSATGNGIKYGVGLGSSETVTGWNISGSSFIEYDFRAHASTSVVQPAIAGGNSSITETLGTTISDPYSATQYVKLYRLTSTTAKMEFYLQPDYSDTPVTLNVTMSNTPTGLRYLFIRLFYEGVSDSNTIVASDFKIYNGITSITLKPTNVQDNSLLVEKDTENRYWFSKAPVVTDDLTTDKGWVSNTSDWTYNASGDYIDFATIRRSTTAQQIYIDVQDSDYLGSGNNLSDSAWTANFKVKTGTSASGNAMIYLGFSNNLADSGTTQQSATMKMNMSSSEGSLSLSVSRANFETSSSPARENADIYSSGNIPYSTDFYMTMTRSGDVFTLKAYSNSARTTQVGVTATVTVTGISSLRYIKAFNDSEQNQSYTSTGARLYDMEIINGADTWTWGNPKSIGRAIFASGVSPSTNVIDYITIATTGNATDFGDSLKSAHDGSAVGSILKAVFGGGTGSTTDSKLEYISFQTLGNATAFGAMLSGIGGNSGACGDGSRGIWGQNTAMQYITIDTPATSISFGTLGNNHGSDPASCADSTRGLWGGGEPSSDTNAMSYVTIQTLGNSTDFGDLTVARRQFTAVADVTRGCFAGGYSGSYSNTIDYVTIQTPSNASDFGDLTQARVTTSGGAGDDTRGCYGGGDTGGGGGSGAQNTIDYITIATTGNATDFGNLTVSRSRANGASDYVK